MSAFQKARFLDVGYVTFAICCTYIIVEIFDYIYDVIVRIHPLASNQLARWLEDVWVSV